jgi:hypothetical protein
VRANYDLGAFGIGGYFSHATGDEFNTWRLVGMYTLGANEFHLNYGGTNNVKVDGWAKPARLGKSPPATTTT